ncbi:MULTISPECIES: hypothetical protein [unclassified Pseudomonas]|uniref:hypothetical protein n=1 Tax=unclassified Pseudomonas TaxID=196821 RepID=UPI00215C2ECD|nr:MULTISPECIES: hypothetical protein [unclassified Pseudomonas]MCR8931920.1 hypothetical protein [Pseudomonas sp. S11A4]MCR8975530.1 hypothetical protein [Pseudomonas sp. S11P7]
MDYPISVPSVGLVGGKFVDEDPLAGTPGSLIPAQWGNAVTDEIIHVITGAGLTPDELNNMQLLAAIKAVVTQSGVSPGRLIGVRVFNVAGTFTYNATPGTNSVIEEVQGAGGGSGGLSATGATTGAASGGGSAGAYAIARHTSGFNGVTVTVGAKGAGGAAGANNGSAGGSSSFGSLVTAPGGPGGLGGAAAAPPAVGISGAASAAPTGGNIYQNVGAAASSSLLAGLSAPIFGPGASTKFGCGQRGNSSSATVPAIGYGVGGGGCVNGVSSPALAGADGSGGIVIVWEYA